ncbi:hypothetical protein ACPDIT_03745 [Limisphaera sp. VF-2]
MVPLSVPGGMAVADSVRVLQRHWVEARARAQTAGTRNLHDLLRRWRMRFWGCPPWARCARAWAVERS